MFASDRTRFLAPDSFVALTMKVAGRLALEMLGDTWLCQEAHGYGFTAMMLETPRCISC